MCRIAAGYRAGTGAYCVTRLPQYYCYYANQFADDRPVKSTSIGIKDSSDKYVAALCLNVDMTLFPGIQRALAQFTEIESSAVVEHLEPATGSEAIR